MTRQLVFVCLLVCLGAVAASAADVIFVDSGRQYLKKDSTLKGSAVWPSAIAASTAVLLGVPLPSGVDSSAASQLEQIVIPDVFSRPRAIVQLFVAGVDAASLEVPGELLLGSQHAEKLQLASSSGSLAETPGDNFLAAIAVEQHLTDLLASSGDGISFRALACGAGAGDCDKQCVEEELRSLARTVGGWYEDGVFSLTLSGTEKAVTLDTSKAVEGAFLRELACLLGKAQRVGSRQAGGAPELFAATLSGMQALKAEVGADAPQVEVARRVLSGALQLAIQSLQEAREGRLVASVILSGADSLPAGPSRLGSAVAAGGEVFSSRFVRRLEEDIAEDSSRLTMQETTVVVFVVLLLIITLLSANCCLFTMPLTKDTLLYAGVKLD
eukprot:TRINITY_DN6709_c0_g1_i1.p1 TRINITY_DN6709_c0_g1~~TRINITY_DN6709_c0_g1_i1.p1  ORF type:complete len:385 (+),score=95.31 TRINITY_DN6709_c0_g1_i1:218-1372(+)